MVMTEKKVQITSDSGVHARPAMMLVKEAMKFECEVFLIKGNAEANAKSIMSVLALGITSGTELLIRANGDRESEIVDALVSMIQNDFK